MRLLSWLKQDHRKLGKQRREWRIAWNAAIEGVDATALTALRAQLDSMGTDGGDVEIELEMLDALEHLVEVNGALSTSPLPTVETHHRVIGSEVCHFTAPASVPSDQSQPSGRVLFTPTRSLFVGGGRTSASPWHAVHHVIRQERDLLLARADGASGAHFRFNTYTDAVVATVLAQRLRRKDTK